MGQTTIIIMILTIISKIFGFVRESVMAAFIGAGELKSIYTTAMTIPNLVTGIIITGVVSAYIPVYNKVKNEKNEEEAINFTSNLINILMVYGTIAFIFIFIFARPLTKIFSPNLSGNSLDLAVDFTRIIMLSVFSLLYSSVIRGFLNIKGNFIDPVITGIILNIFIIISTILTGKIGNPYILIIGALVANIIQIIRYPYVSRKLNYRHRFKLDFNDKYIKYLMLIIIPIILSGAANQFSVLIDNSMASAFFGVSSISKIFYARTLLGFITGVVTTSISTVIFPEIAKLGQNREFLKMKSKVDSSIVIAMLLVIPATLGMVGLSNPIVKLAFERNVFTNKDTLEVATLLVSYSPNIIFGSIITIITNAYYSKGDSKTPVCIMIFQQIVNVVLNIILSKIMGINGLAIATSVSTIIGSAIIIYDFNKLYKKNNNYIKLMSVIKISGSSIVMCIISRIIFAISIIRFNLIMSLMLSILISGLVYCILIVILKIPEVTDITGVFLKKMKEHKGNINEL